MIYHPYLRNLSRFPEMRYCDISQVCNGTCCCISIRSVGAGRAGADGPELVAGSDDARRNGGGRGCVLCGYQHGCLSTVMSRDHW